MFEKIGRLAETTAIKVSLSRRGFLDRLGQRALVLTGVFGGLVALPKDALAGGVAGCVKKCCEAACGKGTKNCSCDPTGSLSGSCYEDCISRGF